MPDPEPELTIGELARLSGRRASAIRYYESRGVLPAPERISGKRRYARDAIQRLAVIETGQRAGLSLDEIKGLLDASPGDPRSVERLRAIAERRLPELDALKAHIELVTRWLEQAGACECPSLSECGLFGAPECLPPSRALRIPA